MLELLHSADINVEYMYAILGNKTSQNAYMIFRVNDNDKASAVLQGAGVKLVEQAELSAL